MTEEQYYKAKSIQEEIEQLRSLFGDEFRHITTVTTYNRGLEHYYTREFQISEDLSKEIVKCFKDRLERLQIEMENS